MIGQGFAVAKRQVAMFCMALCMALSVQMTMVVLERLQHVFQVEHAPNGLAGPVFDHGHHLKVDVEHVPGHPHEDLAPADEIAFSPEVMPDHGPITHHHHGSGMLTPWLVSASLQIVVVPAKASVLEFGVSGHPDAPAWRCDRPPKLNLERIV